MEENTKVPFKLNLCLNFESVGSRDFSRHEALSIVHEHYSSSIRSFSTDDSRCSTREFLSRTSSESPPENSVSLAHPRVELSTVSRVTRPDTNTLVLVQWFFCQQARGMHRESSYEYRKFMHAR